MGGGSVVATVAVQVRIEVVAPLEGSLGVVDPLVKVTDHVVEPVLVRASRPLAGPCERPFKLVEARVDHVAAVAPFPAVLRLVVEVGIEKAHGAAPVVVAAPDLAPVAIGEDGLLRPHAGVLPFIRLAEALATSLASGSRLQSADVSLREDSRRADRTHDHAGR